MTVGVEGTDIGVSMPVGRVAGVVTTGVVAGDAKELSAPTDQSVARSGIVCTGVVNPVGPPIQVETGSRVARTKGKSGVGVAAAVTPRPLPPIIGERNNTPI